MQTDGLALEDVAPRRRSRWKAMLRPPRRLKFTRMGRFYVGFSLVVGGAAINTGNNLLFLLLGLMLAGIVVSGVLSESTLRGLSVSRSLPLEAQAGKACLVGLTVHNTKARTSSWSVIARDVTSTGEAGRSFVLHLGAGQSRELSYRWQPERRGRVLFERVELATRYPFGLFEKWREFDLDAECIVFPREVPPPPTRARQAAPPGERPTNQAGQGSEFFALRDARTGDDVRHIHWATSARRGRPVAIDREREHRRRLAVVVDNRAPAAVMPEDLDRAAQSAAALVRQAAKQGAEISLVTSEQVVPVGSGPAHERRMLRVLALMGPAAGGAPPARPALSDIVEVSVVASGEAGDAS